MSSTTYPSSVFESQAALRDIATEPQYESYTDFLIAAEKRFPDLKWARKTLERDYHLTRTGSQSCRGAVYAVDIVSPDARTHTVVASEPQTKAADVAKLLANAAPVLTKMRVVIFDHGKIFDPLVLQEIAGFYDLNPRILWDHFYQHHTDTAISNLNLDVRDTYPGYLPSESKFSPIQLERTILTRPKKTTLLIPNKKAEYPTVIVFIWSPLKRYSTNVVNRDIVVPSQMIPSRCMSNVYQPSSDAETFLLRLSNYSNFELEACISQPILILQPFLRIYLIEISQDIKQICDHITWKGLNEVMEDRENRSWDDDDNWGIWKTMPFRAFQWLNFNFTASMRTLQDHLSAPWVDHLKPNMEFAHAAKELMLGDAKRVQDQMEGLRAKVNEHSAYSAAQESINEARKSVAQAESVTQLTRLAFIYIPLTYATSLFGINITEWQDAGMPSGKWFIATSIICTFVTIIGAFTLARCSNAIQRHGGLVRSSIYGFKKYTILGIFYVLVTLPRRISDWLSDLFTFRRKERAMV